jgi:GT2 family glycosyltransferase
MLSIIVPARNDGKMTRECLGALLHALERLRLQAELILIDDASEPGEGILDAFRETRQRARGQNVKIIRAANHRHYSGVFSLGLHFAQGDRVFFLSNDMLVTPSFLLALLSVSALDTKIGIVRGTSNYTDSHPEYHIQPDRPLAGYNDILSFSAKRFAEGGIAFREDAVLSGDAVLISRALIDAIGVLDLRFFGYFGDVDYGMRAHLAGFKLVCALGAWLYHVGGLHVTREMQQLGESDPGAAGARRMALVETAYAAFREKWGATLPPRYSDCPSLHFFPVAQAARDRTPLRHEMPASALEELEFH